MSIQRVHRPSLPKPQVVSPNQPSAPPLPPWESFPTEDRQRLVRAILLAAQRQTLTTHSRMERDREMGR